MKRNILFLFVGILSFALFSFSEKEVDNKYPDSSPAEHIEFFKNDFIKVMDSEILTHQLENNFKPLFDKINSVDAQYNADFGHYYLVMGSKNNIEKVELLKVEKSDIENNTYSFIDFTNINLKSGVEYCLRGPQNPSSLFVCQGPCAPRNTPCLGIICGIAQGGNCLRE